MNKKIIFYFLSLCLSAPSFSQTINFNMRRVDNGRNYTIAIDAYRGKITAKKNNSTEFTCNYYNCQTGNNVIGLAFCYFDPVPMKAQGSCYFLINKGGSINAKLLNGRKYQFKAISTSDFTKKYNQFAKAINTTPDPPTPPSSSSYQTFTVNRISFNMIKVPGGTFTMGDDEFDDTKPAHKVTLSSFMIGQTEVTQALWKAVMGNNPSEFTGLLGRPVDGVNWNDCQKFINKLNLLTGQKFRLPTEAEWEFAANRKDVDGDEPNGWSEVNSEIYDEENDIILYGGTFPVATSCPNVLGIYDMIGNVYEWCQDWYDENYYRYSPANNPQGPSSGFERVMRGGSFFGVNDNNPYSRPHYKPDEILYSGLRLAL